MDFAPQLNVLLVPGSFAVVTLLVLASGVVMGWLRGPR